MARSIRGPLLGPRAPGQGPWLLPFLHGSPRIPPSSQAGLIIRGRSCQCATAVLDDAAFKEGRTEGRRPNLVLGIETSCDETGAAVVTTDGRILGEALASQAELHAQWGGVVPALAKGEHAKAIDGVVRDALLQAGAGEGDLSAVAVTVGPGLGLCLQVGVKKARAIAKAHQLPLVPVHHMEAHALVARMGAPDVKFPFLTLLISGGHNLLLLARGVGDYAELGTTLDDALGVR